MIATSSVSPVRANSTAGDARLYGLLMAWVCLAALGQLIHLASWPMYLLGVPVTWAGKAAVVFVRLGIYAGLAWGLARHDPAAWAGTVLELGRTFAVFVLGTFPGGGAEFGFFYPAPWTHGLLSGALPPLMVVNLALSRGWSPGPDLERTVYMAARVLGALAGIGALWLRRQAPEFRVPPRGHGRLLFAQGMPFVLAISAAEAAAYLLARGITPG